MSMMWAAIGTTTASLVATGVGTGMSYMAAQDEASQQKAIADQNYQIQKRNAKINATIAKQQAALKKTYADASMRAKEVNATSYEAEAAAIEAQSREEARRMREQGNALIANQKSAYAASGVTSEGSPIMVMAETAGRLELAVQDAKWQSDQQANQYRDAAKVERYNKVFDQADMLVADYEAQLAKLGQSLNMDEAYFNRSAGYSQASATRTAAYGTLISGASSMAGTVADFSNSSAGQKLFGSSKTLTTQKTAKNTKGAS